MTTKNKPTINEAFKIILILLLIIAFGIAVFKVVKAYYDNYSISMQTKSLQQQKIDLTRAKVWQDKYNQTHIELERTKVDKAILEVQVDSLARILKIKPKQVESLTQIKSDINLDKPLTITNVVDTIQPKEKGQSPIINKYTKFQYKDKWIDIVGDVNHKNKIKIQGQDTLTKTDYWKKKWFLGSRHYYSDISNKNPHINITGVKQVESDIKDTHWSVGPYIGVGYQAGDFSRAQLSVGISLQYSIIKF
jgi:hypothetical protein